MRNLIIFGLLGFSTYSTAACQADPSQYQFGAPGALKLFHVTGSHQCQSRQNIGYWQSVEVRDATDCTSGHTRLRSMNPCSYFNGTRQDGGVSIGYTPGRCTPLL